MPFSRAIVWRASSMSKFCVVMVCSSRRGLLLLAPRRRRGALGCRAPLEHGAGLGDLVVGDGVAGHGDAPVGPVVDRFQRAGDAALAVDLLPRLHRDFLADEPAEVVGGAQR